MTLASAQRLFWDAIAGAAPPAGALSEVFAGTPGLPAADRVAIYVNMVLYRQVDALREDFPCLAALCGDEAFFALARAYLAAHPSAHPSLSRLGAHLPAFLTGAVARAALGAAARPDLSDLAALEWARSEVFDEADAAPQGPDALARLGADRFAGARVTLVPALRRLSLGFDAAAVFEAVQGGAASDGAPAHDANGAHQRAAHQPIPQAAFPPSRPAPSAVVVWRHDARIFHVRIAGDEAEALQLAADGATLGEVCGAFGARADPAGAAFAALRSWFADGWVAASG